MWRLASCNFILGACDTLATCLASALDVLLWPVFSTYEWICIWNVRWTHCCQIIWNDKLNGTEYMHNLHHMSKWDKWDGGKEGRFVTV